MVKSKRCKYCNKPVRWAKHVVTGKLALLNIDGDPDGNVILLMTQPLTYLIEKAQISLFDEPMTRGPQQRTTNHYADCTEVGRAQARQS